MSAVGVIGLGAMGAPIARHLLAHGHSVTGYDIKPEAVQDLSQQGGQGVASASAVAANSRIILVILVDDRQVLDACLGRDGILAGAAHDAVIVILSSVSPATCREVQRHAAAKGVHVLDAPMVRGEAAAHTGRLLLMIGGETQIVARCRPVFECFASDLCHLGALGAGAVGKVVNNMLLWTAVVANYEGIRFAEVWGVDAAVLRESLKLSSGDNWALREWERITSQPKWWDQKDLAGALELAKEMDVAMPLATLVKELMQPLRPEQAKRLFAEGKQ